MPDQKLKIGIAQLELTDKDWRSNLDRVENAIDIFSKQKPDFVIFPELWPSAMQLKSCQQQAAINRDTILPRLQILSKEKNLWIHCGSMLIADQGKCYNQAVLINPAGEYALVYRKMHLFGLMGEDQYLGAGNELPVCDTPFAKVATGICYDLRFPELFRYYALQGAQIIFLPSEWPHPRLYHWRELIIARAIENQVYMVSCNRVGKSEKYEFFGHSMIVDPWGEIIYEAPESEILKIVEIDLARVSEARAKLNTLADVRPEIFKKMQ